MNSYSSLTKRVQALRRLNRLTLTLTLAVTLSAAWGGVVQSNAASQELGSYAMRAFAPSAATVDDSVALLDPNGRALGPHLDAIDFCDLAYAGAGVVGTTTYRVVTTGAAAQAFCGRYYTRLHRRQPVAAGRLGRSRFERIQFAGRDWPHGIGARGWLLAPGRTAAAKRGGANIGDVLFVPALLGSRLFDGTQHDGHIVVTDIRDDLDAPIALYLGITGTASAAAWQPPASTLRAEVANGRGRDARVERIEHAERIARLRATLRYVK